MLPFHPNQKILWLPSIYEFETTGTNLNHPTFLLIFACHYPFLHSNVNHVKGNCSMSIFFLSVKPFATKSQMTEKKRSRNNWLSLAGNSSTVLSTKQLKAGLLFFPCTVGILSNFSPVFHILVFSFLYLLYLFIQYSVKVNCSMSIFFCPLILTLLQLWSFKPNKF
mgnify:FL=1